MTELEEIVERCLDYIFTDLRPVGPGPISYAYDIVYKYLDDNGWSVTFEMAFDPSKLIVFSKTPRSDRINITTYIKAYRFSIPKF